MNSFMTYFKRRFLSTWMITAVVTVVGLLILTILCTRAYTEWKDGLPNRFITSSFLYEISIFGIIVAILLPISEFAPFNSKKNLDMMFSAPIGRTKLLMAHYLNGALTIALSLTIIFVVWFFGWVLLPTTELHVGYSLLAYPLMLLSVLITYTFYSFAFLQANTVFDGCVYMVIYTYLVALITSPLARAFPIMDNDPIKPANMFDLFSNRAYPYIIPIITSNVLELITEALIDPPSIYPSSGSGSLVPTYYYREFYGISNLYLSLIITFVSITIIAFIIMITSFKRRTPIQAEEISDSWFGYKVLIPICAVCCGLHFGNSSPFYILTPLATLVGYVIYRRSLKIKIFDIAMVVLAAVLPHI